ncbi:hypothetical protein EDB81DRAFT_89423 [Dactylonectria macrodidyma]|uniref:Uncharacterized protein n=1 Tax=Dactylonectria macrodidyma TaxID=307937 RepID=A0A9P9IST6_9HYPO|nr:hypothetical protein EDB81DRAFT_89423 [Dactylonectria macrodidyma]
MRPAGLVGKICAQVALPHTGGAQVHNTPKDWLGACLACVMRACAMLFWVNMAPPCLGLGWIGRSFLFAGRWALVGRFTGRRWRRRSVGWALRWCAWAKLERREGKSERVGVSVGASVGASVDVSVCAGAGSGLLVRRLLAIVIIRSRFCLSSSSSLFLTLDRISYYTETTHLLVILPRLDPNPSFLWVLNSLAFSLSCSLALLPQYYQPLSLIRRCASPSFRRWFSAATTSATTRLFSRPVSTPFRR